MSIIAWDTSTTNSMFNYMGAVFEDFAPLLLLIVSVSLGVWAFSIIISSLRS